MDHILYTCHYKITVNVTIVSYSLFLVFGRHDGGHLEFLEFLKYRKWCFITQRCFICFVILKNIPVDTKVFAICLFIRNRWPFMVILFRCCSHFEFTGSCIHNYWVGIRYFFFNCIITITNITEDTKIIALCLLVTVIWHFLEFGDHGGSHLEFLEFHKLYFHAIGLRMF
jgi:hypothetical protein